MSTHKHILIIGNGFDLAHGLKTAYKDFLTYCNTKISSGVSEYIKNIWILHFINRQSQLEDTWIDVENEIYNVIKKISSSISLYKDKSITINLPRTHNKDFSLYDIYAYIDKNSNLRYNFGGKPTRADIQTLSFKNSQSFVEYLYKQLRDFTKLFEKYLTEEVLARLNYSEYNLHIGSTITQDEKYILSFNYTDTFERLYGNSYRVIPTYIHGKVSQDDNCNLVLGTHSFKNNNDNDCLPIEFNIFRKHNQRHKYNTIENYQHLLRELDSRNNNNNYIPVFHIIGHSLNKTDHTILKHILLKNDNAEINIYYHNEYAQEYLINNITDIIGEENVISKVRMIHQHDDKAGILKRKLPHLTK